MRCVMIKLLAILGFLLLPLGVMANKKVQKALQHQLAKKAHNHKDVFTTVYNKQQWGGYPETKSGSGSTIKNTAAIRDAIPGILKELGVKTMLDMPCGDFNWLKTVDLSMLDAYIGIDIVTDIVRHNNRRYGSEKHTFLELNVVAQVPPKADLILCRDLLLHLYDQDVKKVVENIKKSGARYLLMSSNPCVQKNTNLPRMIAGRSRPINLQLEPFNFPEPLLDIDEHDGHGKHLMLWSVDTLP